MTLTKKQLKQYLYILLGVIGGIFLIVLFLIGRSEGLSQSDASQQGQISSFKVTGVNNVAFTYTVNETSLIVTSMATWCSSCIQNSVNLKQAIQESNRNDIQIIAISIDPTDDRDKLSKFQSRYLDNSWLVIPHDAGDPKIIDIFKVKTIDQSIVVSLNGQITDEFYSIRTVGQWKEIISKI